MDLDGVRIYPRCNLIALVMYKDECRGVCISPWSSIIKDPVVHSSIEKFIGYTDGLAAVVTQYPNLGPQRAINEIEALAYAEELGQLFKSSIYKNCIENGWRPPNDCRNG